jgi:acyl carrier protein
MQHMPRCPVCGNFDLPEFYEPRGYALCPRCGAILRRLRNQLVRLYDIEPKRVNLGTSFLEDLRCDFVDIVELVMALEEEFGMKITNEEAEKLKTVKDVVRFLEGRGYR